MRWGLVVVALLGACVTASVVPCDDGRACPAGTTCTANGCATPDAIAQCDGKLAGAPCGGNGVCVEGACVVAVCGNGGTPEPGEACDDGNRESGDGCNGTCTSDESCGNALVENEEECDCGSATAPSGLALCQSTINGGTVCSTSCRFLRCGNGVIDPGELCDDQNITPGDGCSFDCRSDETCGNGTLDFFAGETCDDNNLVPYDGCSVRCGPDRLPIWSKRMQSGPLRYGTAGAYDVARDRIVVFGGEDSGTLSNDTWEWEGNGWRLRHPAIRPLARSGAAMAYDAKRGRLVLFGGRTQQGLTNDMWTWNGVDWTRIVITGIAPAPRAKAGMIYDIARDRIVVVGDDEEQDPDPTVWELDPAAATWMRRTLTTELFPARRGVTVAYQPEQREMYLFGGLMPAIVAGTPLDDVWTYDGTMWEPIQRAPVARGLATMAFDSTAKKLILNGGQGANATTLDDAWTWQLGWASGKGVLGQEGSLVWDVLRKVLVMIGGRSSPNTNSANGGTRLLATGATNWTDFQPDASPATSNSYFVGAWDEARGRLVMYRAFAVGSGETWEWNGARWRLAASTQHGFNVLMTFDAARRAVLLQSGTTSTSSRTYLWNGTAWSAIADGPLMSYALLAYDKARARAVMLTRASINAYETWLFDGTTWTRATPAHSPPPRAEAVLVYDERRERIVLAAGTPNDPVWEWDGTDWAEHATATQPPTTSFPSVIYDRDRGRVVMHGGTQFSTATSDTWEYNGVDWRLVTAASPPSARSGHIAAYDPLRREMIVFGGGAGLEAMRWEGEPEEACESGLDLDGDGLVGCADPSCWSVCTPLCAPGTSCDPSAPRCGDGTCGAVENCRSCAADCGACNVCGDARCDGTETTSTCPADCF